jgi:hypothetical protein
MKKIILLIILLSLTFYAKANNPSLITVHVFNVCQYYQTMVVFDDDSANAASFGFAGCYNPYIYSHFDSLDLKNVIGFQLDDSGPQPYDEKYFCIADSARIYRYKIKYSGGDCNFYNVMPIDTIYTDSIAQIDLINGRLVVLRSSITTDNLLIYDTLSTNPIFSLLIDAKPVLLDLDYASIYIAAIDSLIRTELLSYNLFTYALQRDTILGTLFSNPYDIYGNSVIAEPGDSITTALYYSFTSNSYQDTILNPYSGIHCGDWSDGTFYYQPETDSTTINLSDKIYSFNLNINQPGSMFNINKRLEILSLGSSGSGYYPYIFAVSDDSLDKNILVYDKFNFTLVDSVVTPSHPRFFYADFRCPISIEEYDDSQINWSVYPNPVNSGNINFSVSGLICGRDYLIDVADETGKVFFTTPVHAKMTFAIPVDDMPAGVYFIRVHSLQGLKSQKFIKN